MRKDPFGRKTKLNGDQAAYLRAIRPAGVVTRFGITFRGSLTKEQRRAISNMNIGYRGGDTVNLTGMGREKDTLAQYLREQGIPFIEGEID